MYKRQHLDNQSLVRPKLQCLSGTMYNFKGKAAHASAAPWEGRNAFNAAQLFFHAIDMLRQHTLPETQFHGIIHKGGEAPNLSLIHICRGGPRCMSCPVNRDDL